MKRILYILAIALSIVACTDDIDKSNRYTFTGETVADYMLNRSENYSHMITLMERAGLFGLLRTYGQYTLFLPDNDAVEKYVQEQDSIYHATKDSDNPVWTGVISPYVEELSDSMANVIARMHLIENRNYHTADMGEGALGKWNFNDRALSVSYKVVDERFYIMLNNSAAIIAADNQVENGIVHIIDRPIDPKFNTIASHISEYTYFSIFNQAIAVTGFTERVSQTVDLSYDYRKVNIINKYWRIPEHCYIKFTAFIEPDEVFHANGIYTLDDLKTFAEKWYGTEEKGNYKNPKNALYKFVAYHFVEGEIPYNRVVISRSGVFVGEEFDYYYIPGFDLYNYYPTMQGTLLKALKPLSTTDGLNIYLNYSKRKIPYNFEMRNHTNVRIIELTEFTQMNERYANFVPNASNGLVHPIDKILIYNEDEMVGNILNERMRFDVASLQPELSSNNIWHNDAIEIPSGYCKGIKTHHKGSSTGMRYRGVTSAGYNIDFIDIGSLGGLNFDISILFPPVPPRTYEIRISVRGYPEHLVKIPSNEKYQLYFDDKVCGNPLPILIVPNNNYNIGWVKDADTYDNGVENDKHMRNLGWMKGPDSWRIASVEGNTVVSRDSEYSLRKIIHRQYLDEGEHWLRFRYIPPTSFVQGGRNYAISLDYIELVPLHIVSDPITPEDRH